MPIVSVVCLRSPLASRLVLYPRRSAAVRTLAASSGSTRRSEPDRTRDTVATETLAAEATSRIVTKTPELFEIGNKFPSGHHCQKPLGCATTKYSGKPITQEVFMSAQPLADRVVLVTGATSGIGRACARALAADGARVVLGGRRQERLDELVADLGDERCIGVRMDVRRPADARRLVSTAHKKWNRVDALVLSAGIGAYGSILDHTDDLVATMIDTNITGTIWPLRAALPQLLANPSGGGDIVIIASVAGLRGGANEAVYAATKFAQIGLAGAVDRDLAPQGVRVTSICPAATRTEFALGLGRTADTPGQEDWLTPEDVAAAVITTLRQPRHMRTQLWSMWSMAETG
jgi:3-oxoacyl-[acyl-carrier protein] reductase